MILYRQEPASVHLMVPGTAYRESLFFLLYQYKHAYWPAPWLSSWKNKLVDTIKKLVFFLAINFLLISATGRWQRFAQRSVVMIEARIFCAFKFPEWQHSCREWVIVCQTLLDRYGNYLWQPLHGWLLSKRHLFESFRLSVPTLRNYGLYKLGQFLFFADRPQSIK